MNIIFITKVMFLMFIRLSYMSKYSSHCFNIYKDLIIYVDIVTMIIHINILKYNSNITRSSSI